MRLIAAIVLVLLVSPIVGGHPGRTDGDGGHFCRTNCADWGLEDGEYHTHGVPGVGISPPAPTTGTATEQPESGPAQSAGNTTFQPSASDTGTAATALLFLVLVTAVYLFMAGRVKRLRSELATTSAALATAQEHNRELRSRLGDVERRMDKLEARLAQPKQHKAAQATVRKWNKLLEKEQITPAEYEAMKDALLGELTETPQPDQGP